jgi:hypothetical protein
MTETEKRPLPPTAMPAGIARGIAKDAQEHLGGLDVISIGPIFADEYAGDLYLQLYTVLPIREGDEPRHPCLRARHAAAVDQSDGADHDTRNAFWARADFQRRAGIRKRLPEGMAKPENGPSSGKHHS